MATSFATRPWKEAIIALLLPKDPKDGDFDILYAEGNWGKDVWEWCLGLIWVCSSVSGSLIVVNGAWACDCGICPGSALILPLLAESEGAFSYWWLVPYSLQTTSTDFCSRDCGTIMRSLQPFPAAYRKEITDIKNRV